VKVDSFVFLPRSFRPMYESPEPLETGEVWAPFEKRLAESTIALVTSAGLYIKDDQEPFDMEGERRNPLWGDPSHRVIPAGTAPAALGMCHLHVNNADVLEDANIALPDTILADLVVDGVVGAVAREHVAVMGFQEAGLEVWREETAPAIVEVLGRGAVDGVVLAPV